jgi:hypothetical protein
MLLQGLGHWRLVVRLIVELRRLAVLLPGNVYAPRKAAFS